MELLFTRWMKGHAEDTISRYHKYEHVSATLQDEKRSISEIVAECFDGADALFFFCASGIAVRSIAPYLQHKSKDPAVIVIDETGSFSISLVSGHLGGANALAKEAAELLSDHGTIPVITTASDLEGKFSPDLFAKKNQLLLTDFTAAKKLTTRILRGERIRLTSCLPIDGMCPGEVAYLEWPEHKKMAKMTENDAAANEAACETANLIVSMYQSQHLMNGFSDEAKLLLIPRVIVIGIGCKKGTPKEEIEAAVRDHLLEQSLAYEALCGVVSIDLKKGEPGILRFCEKYSLPFRTFPAEELQGVPGMFTTSSFVQKMTGTDNVCERSVVAAGATLLSGKRAKDGVTTAIGMIQRRLRF